MVAKNSHAIWQQAYSLGFTAVGWGAWVDGVVYFLDTDSNAIVDHCGFWYDDGSENGRTIHAIGKPDNKVKFMPLPAEYHGNLLYDAAIIYNNKSRRSRNEIVKK